MTERRDDGHEERMAPAASAMPYVAPIGSIAPVIGARDGRTHVAAFRAMYEAQLDFVWRNLRRLGVNEAEVDDIASEWLDRYGPPPEAAVALLSIARLRAQCVRTGVREISAVASR